MVQSRRAWPRLVVWAGLLVGAAGLMWWLVRVVRAGELSANDVLSNVIGLLGLVLGVVSLQQQRRQAAAKGEDDTVRLDRAAGTLAEAVRLQWEAEAGLRGLGQPERLQLRWVTTDRPVAVPIASVAGGAIPGRVVRLRGSLDEIADRYLALPDQRLVVLGEPGAGKSVLALLLTLELLTRHRQRGGPVAVLMGLAAWDPIAEHLHSWLARRLTQDYPALKHPSFGPEAALELVTRGLVLPVLDGLDELPESLRARAITALERARAERPLIRDLPQPGVRAGGRSRRAGAGGRRGGGAAAGVCRRGDRVPVRRRRAVRGPLGPGHRPPKGAPEGRVGGGAVDPADGGPGPHDLHLAGPGSRRAGGLRHRRGSGRGGAAAAGGVRPGGLRQPAAGTRHTGAEAATPAKPGAGRPLAGCAGWPPPQAGHP